MLQEIIVPIETMSKHPGIWREYGRKVVFAQVALAREAGVVLLGQLQCIAVVEGLGAQDNGVAGIARVQ